MADAFLSALVNQRQPDSETMIDFWRQVDRGEQTPQMVLAVLGALSSRPLETETALAFLRYVNSAYPKTRLPVVQDAVNIVGTGGGMETFNISTTAAFVAAAAGVRVLKSGSRAYSSRVGAQDVLERLGIRVPADDEVLIRMLEELGIGFVPGARYPALCRRLVQACQPLSFRLIGQIVNRLGPLLCPYELKGQVIGTANPELLRVLACAAQELALDNLLFTHATVGADEMLPFGLNLCWWVRQRHGASQWHELVDGVGKEYRSGDISRIRGGNVTENAERLQCILAGKDCDEALDAVAWNAAAALLIARRVDKLQDGMRLARGILDSGKALVLLRQTQAFCRELRRAR
ncbi:anthranilate phosphoribosyltransferase [Jejubacter calystegiae]|uniref:Anthranilate phosphoribosyltransferase n=1 Tax=Jejubacter calystegiae TaxID=2579935 RepID=A0A4V1G7N9_9ENTR|nr:anthranilate phosphoribosyltransferase [Jejubacter calystegiae]QCT20307.1 anthranilate phosphoribosyltransferase [Jejubacter calystegiae]